MELTELIDFDRVQDLVGHPLQVKRFGLYDVTVLSREQPEALLEFGAAAWQRIVQQRHFSVDPRMMRTYFDTRNPAIIQAIERVTKIPLIQDLGWTEATIQYRGQRFVVATSSAARLTLGNLHFGDISVKDPRFPLKKTEWKSEFQTHRGLGLLSQVMNNVVEAARERDSVAVTLQAATSSLVPVFNRFGFDVEDNDAARAAMKFGMGIPMHLLLKKV
jgi:hypothetical protein